MVKQKNNIINSEISKLNETETKAVVNYISQILSTRIHQSNENIQTDDLIVKLSDDYENIRARQVFEWEKVRRQHVSRTVGG